MDIEEEIAEEAVNAAWNKFQRMPSSNPSDFAHAVVRAVMPLVKRAQAEAWAEGARAGVENAARQIWDDGDEISNPYIAEANRIEQNSEGNET